MSGAELSRTEPGFRPCAVVPIYNHGETIGGTVDELRRRGLPSFVVDDGSEEPTRLAVERLAGGSPAVTVRRLERNSGKGAAVCCGMEAAYEAGFTHALQVDADGQHDLDDVQRFLDVGEENPLAVVLGQPRFDSSAPLGRRLGRRITTFWVTIETLSGAVGDAMCGFRLYPLGATLGALRDVRIAPRMEFDVEIVVRLYWEGVPIRHVETDVIYPEGGRSHFRMVRDNVRISLAHTRLVIGMMWRLPRLLRLRRARQTTTVDDSGRWAGLAERGSLWGLRFLLFVYAVIGRRACSLLMRVAVAYFFVTGARARRASREYLERLWAHPGGPEALGRKPSTLLSWRHFVDFGEAGIDKIAAWRGDIPSAHLRWSGREELVSLLEQSQGALLVGAHLGNVEMGRAVAGLEGLRINALMFRQNAERFNRIVRDLTDESSLRVVALESISPATVLSLREKIAAGEMVSLLADRVAVGAPERTGSVSFLGAQALLPLGPWVLAGLLRCPVFLVFFLREGPGRYLVKAERFADRIELPRRDREASLRATAQRYAERLEEACLQAPLQWYNFYRFWPNEEP